MKLTVLSRVEEALNAFAQEHDITPQEAGKRLMEDLNAAFRFGTPEFLGPAWRKEPPSKGSGEESLRSRPRRANEVEPQLTDEQIKLIERNAKLESGFAGVYRTMSGWRATGPDKQWMKTRSTALWAAWERHQAFKALPQPDPIDETMQWLRGRMPGSNEEEIRRHAEEMEALKSGPLPPGM